MLKVEVEKVDYPDERVLGYYPRSQRGVEFRLDLHTPGHYRGGPLSREQLTLFRDQLTELLETTKKPTYTVQNKSSLVVRVITNED